MLDNQIGNLHHYPRRLAIYERKGREKMSTPVAKNVIAGELGKFFSNMQGNKRQAFFGFWVHPQKNKIQKLAVHLLLINFLERERESFQREKQRNHTMSLGYAEKLSYIEDVGKVGMSEICDPLHVLQEKVKIFSPIPSFSLIFSCLSLYFVL